MTTDHDASGGDLLLALDLCERAADLALTHFRAGVRHHRKPDGSPVSEADVAVERVLVDELRRARPDDAILSEEAGAIGSGDRVWILDPIDGTAPFIEGVDGWGTHVALQHAGEIVLGVITRPLQDALWWAVRGGGAYRAPRSRPDDRSARLRVSSTAALSDARMCAFGAQTTPAVRALREVVTWTDNDGAMLPRLAEGRLDAIVAQGGLVWDHAPAAVIVAEAGGRFTDPHGGSRLDLGRGLYTNGLLDAQIREAVRGVWP